MWTWAAGARWTRLTLISGKMTSSASFRIAAAPLVGALLAGCGVVSSSRRCLRVIPVRVTRSEGLLEPVLDEVMIVEPGHFAVAECRVKRASLDQVAADV